MELTLLWAALTAVVLAWLGTRIWPEGLPDHPVDRLVGAGAVGLLIGRIAAMAVQGTNPWTNPGDVLVVRGGVHTGAATIGAIATFLWSVRGRTDYLDAIAPAALLGLAGWHGGCLWRGACLGSAADVSWAWSEPGSLIARHPVEIYAALALAAAAWAVSALGKRPLLRSGAALALAGAIRLATEPIRLSITGGAWGWYLGAITIGVLSALLGPKVTASLHRTQLESDLTANETSPGGRSDTPR